VDEHGADGSGSHHGTVELDAVAGAEADRAGRRVRRPAALGGRRQCRRPVRRRRIGGRAAATARDEQDDHPDNTPPHQSDHAVKGEAQPRARQSQLPAEASERALFAVLEGRVEAVKLVDGIERVVGTRLPGDVFGEVPIALVGEGSMAIAFVHQFLRDA
jgi:hypothetical protein